MEHDTTEPDHPFASNAAPQQRIPHFGIGLARAFAGALIFAFPLLMTMEMWWLGFYMDRFRLALLLLLLLPLLGGLSFHAGFEVNVYWLDHALDPFVAYAVGFITATVMLLLFGVITLSLPPSEIIGKIALQSVPASIGAMLARSQFGSDSTSESQPSLPTSYSWDMFLRLVGAVFLALTAAPTEEIILIAYQMTVWHALALALLSLLVAHAFVYMVEFRGQASLGRGISGWSVFLRFTVVGYALALVVCAYILWTFGRMEGLATQYVITATIVLGFPATLGAAAARLLL
jgi:putative integral membrane protein (TIGR02587 family)